MSSCLVSQLKQIVDQAFQLRPKVRLYEKHIQMYTYRIIVEATVTAMAILSGRERRQVHHGVVPKGLLTFLGSLCKEVAKTTPGILVYRFARQTARKKILPSKNTVSLT